MEVDLETKNPIKILELIKISLEALKNYLSLGKWKEYQKILEKSENILTNVSTVLKTPDSFIYLDID